MKFLLCILFILLLILSSPMSVQANDKRASRSPSQRPTLRASSS